MYNMATINLMTYASVCSPACVMDVMFSCTCLLGVTVNTVFADDVERRRDFPPISVRFPAPHLHNGEGEQQQIVVIKHI